MEDDGGKSKLAGVRLLIYGRHQLYVTSLGALAVDLGARVMVAGPDDGLPDRPPHGVQVIVMESPLPSELRRAAALGVPVVALDERPTHERALAAAQLGATALVDKAATLAELVSAIRDAVGSRPAPASDDLTPRQREVLALLVEGLDNRQIAERLGISERTARAHVSAALRGLGVENRTHAAVAALQRGLIALAVAFIALPAAWAAPAGAAEGYAPSGITASAAPAASPAPGPSGTDSAASTRSLRAAVGRSLRAVGGRTGAWVYDAGSRRALYRRGHSRRLVPASVQKLLTTATALERFGSAGSLATDVLATGRLTSGVLSGNLYLRGGGDPSLGTTGLATLAAELVESGIEVVDGRVFGDAAFFDGRRGGPASGYGTSSYVGPLSGLSFNRGRAAPFGSGFQADPPRFAATRLGAALERLGVELGRGARARRTPAGAGLVASLASPPVAELVRRTNQVSDNFYAETLQKSLGARFGGRGSTAAGAAVVRRFARGLGVSARVVDGSGLSRANSISPAAVGRVLLAARSHPWFDSFYRSLPLAGRTGTLEKRMRRTAAAGRCRAKTGTLAAVSALAGYCRTASGRTLAFALLMNGVNVTAARAAQDRIATALAKY